MTLSRRDVLKAQAAAIAATAANISLPAAAQPIAQGIGSIEIKWSKAAVPLLRHGMRRDGGREGGQGRCDAR